MDEVLLTECCRCEKVRMCKWTSDPWKMKQNRRSDDWWCGDCYAERCQEPVPEK
jgi:hypothetical protein